MMKRSQLIILFFLVFQGCASLFGTHNGGDTTLYRKISTHEFKILQDRVTITTKDVWNLSAKEEIERAFIAFSLLVEQHLGIDSEKVLESLKGSRMEFQCVPYPTHVKGDLDCGVVFGDKLYGGMYIPGTTPLLLVGWRGNFSRSGFAHELLHHVFYKFLGKLGESDEMNKLESVFTTELKNRGF